jgi:lantibiotic transport system ATP-binding protein
MKELLVQTNNLNFSYSKSNMDIENLNLEIEKSSIYGFLGPNGAGKTTTIRLLLGLLKEKSGTTHLFGKPFLYNKIESLAKIGALIETPSLYGHLTARENLLIASNYRGNIPKIRIAEVLEIVKLTHTKNKKTKEFSLGMKQRLGIAIALLAKPELLILDEPTNGLDPKGIIEMRELIKELNTKYGTTIFISSHLLTEIEKTCSHVGIIRNGKMLFQDTVKALKETQSDKLEIELETDNNQKTINVCNKLSLNALIVEDYIINTTVKNRSIIPILIDELRKERINVYQIKIKDNLEELFLSLTEN